MSSSRKITTFKITSDRIHDIEWDGNTVGGLKALLSANGYDIADACATISVDNACYSDAPDTATIPDWATVEFVTTTEEHPAKMARLKRIARNVAREREIAKARKSVVHASCIAADKAPEVSAKAGNTISNVQVTPTETGFSVNVSVN